MNAVYRLAYPSFNIIGALTVRGKVEVQGSSKVDGTDEIPPQWTTSGICPAAVGRHARRRGAGYVDGVQR